MTSDGGAASFLTATGSALVSSIGAVYSVPARLYSR